MTWNLENILKFAKIKLWSDIQKIWNLIHIRYNNIYSKFKPEWLLYRSQKLSLATLRHRALIEFCLYILEEFKVSFKGLNSVDGDAVSKLLLMELPWRFQGQKFRIHNSITIFWLICPKKSKRAMEFRIPNFCPWNRHSNSMNRSSESASPSTEV